MRRVTGESRALVGSAELLRFDRRSPLAEFIRQQDVVCIRTYVCVLIVSRPQQLLNATLRVNFQVHVQCFRQSFSQLTGTWSVPVLQQSTETQTPATKHLRRARSSMRHHATQHLTFGWNE